MRQALIQAQSKDEIMTRIALLSDIHGNLPALEKVIDDLKQFAPDQVVVAGDHINCAPFSSDVMQIITDHRWTLIRGNNEYYCINAQSPRRPPEWAAYTLIEWLLDTVREWRYVIAGLPDDIILKYPDAPDVHLCHGVPYNCWQGIYQKQFTPDEHVREWLATTPAKTIFCGHTHIPLNRHVDDKHILNPGSVGVPLTGERVSQYMILDGDSAGWHVTEQRNLPITADDLERSRAAWATQHFVERCGVAASLVIKELETARIWLYTYNAWKRDQHPTSNDSPELYAAFLQSDMNSYIPAPYRST